MESFLNYLERVKRVDDRSTRNSTLNVRSITFSFILLCNRRLQLINNSGGNSNNGILKRLDIVVNLSTSVKFIPLCEDGREAGIYIGWKGKNFDRQSITSNISLRHTADSFDNWHELKKKKSLAKQNKTSLLSLNKSITDVLGRSNNFIIIELEIMGKVLKNFPSGQKRNVSISLPKFGKTFLKRRKVSISWS